MPNLENKVKVFVNGLLVHPLIQKLKLVDDKGISVSIHTYDVLRLAIKKIKHDYSFNLDEAAEELDFFSILVGIIIHDTTKVTLRLGDSPMSHSAIMKQHPEMAHQESGVILDEVEEFTKLKIKNSVKDHIIHIVVSHHGKWGKVKPKTKEAIIVHEADKYSAMYHRITPIGAKKIVKYLAEGFTKEEVVKLSGYTIGIIEDRLKKARQQLKCKTNRDLVDYYKRGSTIPDGDNFFARRIKETQKLIKKVEKLTFEDLILKAPLIDYIDGDDIFI